MTYKKFYCDPGKPNRILKVYKTEICECTKQHEDEWYELDIKTGNHDKLIDDGWWE